MIIKDLIDINRLKTFLNELKSKFAAASHTHTKSDITDFPTIPTIPSSLKNPYSLRMTKNGTSYTYDGSASAAIGAIYTPTAAGTAGYELISNGSGAPLWKPPNYATCTTAAGTVAKTASVSNFKLAAGVHVTIKFTYAHTATTAATLNVNSTGAKTIYYFHGNQATKDYSWVAGEMVEFVYDGSYWRAVASDRFAKKFADIEDSISNLGVAVSGEFDMATVTVSDSNSITKTYTISNLSKQYTVGFIEILSQSSGNLDFCSSSYTLVHTMPWQKHQEDVWWLWNYGGNTIQGSVLPYYNTSNKSTCHISVNAVQSGDTMTITVTYKMAQSNQSATVSGLKLAYNLFA